ncbi:nitroreductase family protein [Myxococcota bacterium]|nr:nitroreductase family protein [Myxococcota bacterium]MBU1899165.1 nitroreductase family protein [Myxococcota bacterium]
MEFLEVVARRASVYHFTSEAVPVEDLKQMVRVAGMTPSVNNAQPWRYLAVIKGAQILQIRSDFRARIREIFPDPGLLQAADDEGVKARERMLRFSEALATAPALIAVAFKPYDSQIDSILDPAELTFDEMVALRGDPDKLAVGASIQNMILSATNLGYGCCWISAPLMAAKEIEALLGLQVPWRLASLIAVGRPAHPVIPRPKKTLEEIFEVLDE